LNAVARGENVEKTAEELKLVRQTCASNSGLKACLDSPVVFMPVKLKIINEIFAGKIEALTIDFISLLLEKRRFNLLPAISEAIDELIDEMRGRARVSVISALPVNEQERDYLHGRLEKWLKQSVQLSVETNPALLSGIQIRVGDRFYDGSGLGQLSRIRAAMVNY
jgi:F-type H+-transporting ATPase subunit delta